MTRPSRRLPDEAVRELTLDTEPWLSCEDCFALVDVYVETVLADPDSVAMPEMRVHLAGCPACAEEARSLLDLVASGGAEPDIDDRSAG
jgi:hypothetical protein